MRFGAPAWVGPLYPLGSLLSLWIFARSWLGRARVDWKGRTSAWNHDSDIGEFPAACAAFRPCVA